MRRLSLLLLLLVFSCKTNQYTGRRQWITISEASELKMGLDSWNEIQGKVKFTNERAYVDPVRRVGAAISKHANKPDYQWEFKVIDDAKTVNAWALPGGKIAFYKGIYPILQDEAGMAIVMGHEVSHALLRHGAERVSQQRDTTIAIAVGAAVAGKNTKQRLAYFAGLSATAQVLLFLPYSRTHETEADKFGLMLAARAGYDPRTAIKVWERMDQLGGARGPEFLSTHPHPKNRIENMRKWMPEALALYEQSNKKPNKRLPIPPKPAKG